MATVSVAPAWEGYAADSDVDHFAWFCEHHLEQSVDVFDGLPLVLEDWQRELMGEALAITEDGRNAWRSVAIVLPRKNGKTMLLAGYALWRLMYDGGTPEILLAAASDRQAGRLFDNVTAFVRRSQWLLERLTIRQHDGEIVRKDGEGKILRMSSDPQRLHGYNPSLVVCDEVAQWTTPNLRKAWAALTTGGGARAASQTFTISTAGEGHQRTDSILGRLIDANEAAGQVEHRGALTVSRNHDAQTLVYNHSAKTTDPKDIAAIKDANPASWITTEFLQRQAANPELTKAEFLQLHACVWSESDSQWLTADVVAALADRTKIVAPRDVIALGFDGSVFYDATVLMGCRLEDGHLFPLGWWERPHGAAGEGWEVPRGEVDAAIASAVATYTVVRAYFDPPFWQSDVDRWAQEFGQVIVPWFTNRETPMGRALERFRTDALTGAFTHDGDGRLRRHLVNARMAKTRAGYRLEKPGRQSEDKIDGAMAAVLAYEARADAIADGALRPKSKAAAFF